MVDVAQDAAGASARAAALRRLFADSGDTGRLLAQVDWARTPVGPLERWPQSLVTATSICLSSRFPMLIWWGPELVKIYNDAYVPVLGSKHPASVGRPGREVWPEIWDIIGPMLHGVLTEGTATWSDDQLLLLDRHGYVEECYFTFSYSPIHDESGAVGGVFTAVYETTERVVGERRMRLLHGLGAGPAPADDVEACTRAIDLLATDPLDLPFAGIYLADPETGRQQLVASCGQAPEGVLPLSVQAPAGAGTGARPGAPWPMPAPGGDPRVVELGIALPPGPRLPGGPAATSETAETTETAETARTAAAQTELPPRWRQAAVLGLEAAPDTQVGLLVAGVHPQRPLDEQYLAFLRVLARQVATTVAETRAHAAERERAESLAALDAAKTRFFSGVSHELRTPLTLVLGPLERLLAERARPEEEAGAPEEAAGRQDLEIAHRNALRLSRMVDALLDVSRLESGRLEPGRDPLDLTALTADLAATFRAAYESAGLRYDVVCEPLPWPVRVDPLMWERVVLNLLSNALKFTEHGSVRVHLDAEGPNAVLHVQDTGCGISPEDQPHLFERFFRARAASSRSIEGTGIGLSLVREIVELHGGGVDVDSRLGEGSTFTVRLPLAVGARAVAASGPAAIGNGVARRAAPFVEEARRWGTSSQPAALPAQRGPAGAAVGGRPPGGERILVVDDNADLRAHLERLLHPHWRVTTAADGPSALAAARAEPPDLVLSDVMLPGFDGIALLRALREDPGTSSVPVLLLSARAGAEAAVEGLEAGADDYVVKPFSGPELVARVCAILDLARRRAAATAALESARSARRHAERLRGLAHAALLLSAAPTPQAVLTTAVAAVRRLAGVATATAFTETRPPTGPAHRIFAAEPVDAAPVEVEAGGHGATAVRLPLGGHGELDAVPAEGVQLDAGERALLAQLAQLVTDRLHALHLQAQEHAVAERFRLLAEGARDYAIVMLEPDGTVTGWNPGGQHLLGLTAAEAVGTPFPELFPAGEAAELAQRSLQRAGEDAQQDWECALGATPGPGEADARWLNVVLTALHDEDHVLTGFAALLRDVTERKASAQALAYQATHDPLTGLVNRTLFLDRLRAELDHRRREARDVVVLFLDLDGFKWINDSLGHEAGDTLLIELAGRLRGVVRPGDSVARFGGDEFAVLCAGEVDEAEAVRVAERVLEVVSGPVRIDGRELLVTASIGLAVAGPRSDAEGLVRDADVAMYRAKSTGRNRFELFDPVMRRHALERLETEHALRAALDADGLEVLFQPIVALDDLAVVSAEALVRWPHGGRSRLPDEFVPLAEETGLIVPLGAAVLERACREAAAWPPHAQVDVSVNVSAHQVAMPQLPGVVARALEESGLPPERLHLEITETALMADVGASAEALSRLVDLGVGVDIDDFGTGYSSLAYLQRLPVSRLKVDRSFVARIGRTASDDALVRMVVQLAHSLGLRVVAEGVETHEQLQRLRAMGCDSAQGFLLCPPVTTAAMVQRVLPDGRLPNPA
ncbi:MAG TPA: EAL domain-containing protein [Motilibacteraceae bacterium]|nr:EAL domain-containing protein [Motilibacteraceae bacterium]